MGGEHVNYPCCGNSHKPSMRLSPPLFPLPPSPGILGRESMFNLQRSAFEVTFQPGACVQTCRLTLISAPMESQISSAWPSAARQYCWLHFPRWPFSPPPPPRPPQAHRPQPGR